jgi:hypothetical protein
MAGDSIEMIDRNDQMNRFGKSSIDTHFFEGSEMLPPVDWE